MAREPLLRRVRVALDRAPEQSPAPVPSVRLRIPPAVEARAERMLERAAALACKTHYATSMQDARGYVATLTGEKTAIASNAPFLRECGIADLPNVRSGVTDKAELRDLCAGSAFGITSADYALADTGTLVMLASPREARMISLLPPAHVAIVPEDRVLGSLDELLTLLPNPAEQTSSMVLITGPSRTADIEQILVRGVHGPGEVHIVLVRSGIG